MDRYQTYGNTNISDISSKYVHCNGWDKVRYTAIVQCSNFDFGTECNLEEK